MRLSKETVDSDDDAVKYLEETAASTEKCNDCGPGHPLETCPKEKRMSHREPEKDTPVSSL